MDSYVVSEMLKCCQALNKKHRFYRVYPETGMINAEDDYGIIQSFYSTTGTIMIHGSNFPEDHRSLKIDESTIDKFIYFLENPGVGLRRFKNKYGLSNV